MKKMIFVACAATFLMVLCVAAIRIGSALATRSSVAPSTPTPSTNRTTVDSHKAAILLGGFFLIVFIIGSTALSSRQKLSEVVPGTISEPQDGEGDETQTPRTAAETPASPAGAPSLPANASDKAIRKTFKRHSWRGWAPITFDLTEGSVSGLVTLAHNDRTKFLFGRHSGLGRQHGIEAALKHLSDLQTKQTAETQ